MITPGVTLCSSCRIADAALTIDPGERWSRDLCIQCADDEIESESVPREMYELIQRARFNVRYRPLSAPRVDWTTADMTKLNAAKAYWQRKQLEIADIGRCWAILADGTRCVRAEADGGVCLTHASAGCRLPGLGWKGSKPQGRIIDRPPREERVA